MFEKSVRQTKVGNEPVPTHPRMLEAIWQTCLGLVATGEHVFPAHLFAEVDRSDRHELGNFRLGWDFLERRLALRDPFRDIFIQNFCSVSGS